MTEMKKIGCVGHDCDQCKEREQERIALMKALKLAMTYMPAGHEHNVCVTTLAEAEDE